MSDVITVTNWINDAIFVSLVNTALQMTVLIPLIALFIWIFRIKSATIRHSLWLFALFAMVALPLLTPFIPRIDFSGFHHQGRAGYGLDDMMGMGMGARDVGELSDVSGSVPSTSAAKAALNKEIDVSLINPVSIAYFIWCAGALSMFCITIGVYAKLRKLRLRSSDIESQAALEVLSRLRERLGIRRTVTLKASSEVYIPMSMGVLSPVIIVPDSVMDGESSDELEMILTHELAHIKRCDYLVRLLQNVLGVAFFFHPLFHLMKRNLAREREHICDDWVIDVTRRRSEYAECLVDMLERAIYGPVNIPVTLAMAERKRDIPGRVDMIVDRTRKTATKVSRKALTVIFLIGVLSLPIIGGIGLARITIARTASDEGQIVFRRIKENEAPGIWVMDADGRNERQLTSGFGPAWSPDGKQIAFSYKGEETVGREVFVMNADGSNIKQITGISSAVPWSFVNGLTWSPNGRQIAFCKMESKPDGWAFYIYVIDLDGANLKKLIDQKGQNHALDWSPNGDRIVFELVPDNGTPTIWVVDADGNNAKVIYNERSRDPSWSPDGSQIMFTSVLAAWKAGGWITQDIYVMNSDGSNVRVITNPDTISECYPAWSPDGTKIVFVSDRDGPDSSDDLYVMDADGKNVQRITNTPDYDELDPDWTASSHAVEPAGKLKSTWGRIKTLLHSR